MFGTEPCQFKPTYALGEEPALQREGEERSTSPEPVRMSVTKTGEFVRGETTQ